MLRPTTTVIVFGTALLVGLGLYLFQQQKIAGLQAENQSLVAQRQDLAARHEEALSKCRDLKEQASFSDQDLRELLRLRNEITQLRRQVTGADRAANSSAASAAHAGATVGKPGRFISKEDLAFAGYATPETALQSMTWAMMKGTYEETLAALGPELQAAEAKNTQGRQQFEQGRQTLGPVFKGIQMLARKSISEDRIELKIKMYADPIPGTKTEQPEFLVQPMVKVGEEWRLGGSTREYKVEWDQDGQVEALEQ